MHPAPQSTLISTNLLKPASEFTLTPAPPTTLVPTPTPTFTSVQYLQMQPALDLQQNLHLPVPFQVPVARLLQGQVDLPHLLSPGLGQTGQADEGMGGEQWTGEDILEKYNSAAYPGTRTLP